MSGFAGLSVAEATLKAARQRKRRATAALCHQFAPPVYTLACRMLGDRTAAEDITQDTLERMLRDIGQFRGEASFATWVRSIAVSRCLMHQRAAWQQRRVEIDDLDQWQASSSSDQAPSLVGDALIGALEKLSDCARSVVWLHDVEGYSHAEIAALSGRSVSFSKSCLSRARQALRVDLSAHAPDSANRQANPEEPTPIQPIGPMRIARSSL
ncbi:MAG: RNA polymerase sigma factor [Pseudomonadota bacterium]